MKYTVDFYATFLITIEVEADSIMEAENKAYEEDLDAIAARKIAYNNGLPELEYELDCIYEQL